MLAVFAVLLVVFAVSGYHHVNSMCIHARAGPEYFCICKGSSSLVGFAGRWYGHGTCHQPAICQMHCGGGFGLLGCTGFHNRGFSYASSMDSDLRSAISPVWIAASSCTASLVVTHLAHLHATLTQRLSCWRSRRLLSRRKGRQKNVFLLCARKRRRAVDDEIWHTCYAQLSRQLLRVVEHLFNLFRVSKVGLEGRNIQRGLYF